MKGIWLKRESRPLEELKKHTGWSTEILDH